MTAVSEIYRILWYFAVYAVLGWCVEVVYCTVKSGKAVNRGFLNGPVCPVYGFGMLAICKVADILPMESMGEIHFVPLFLAGMVLASLVELIAGWSLFHLFHARWWDYSDRPFNIGGYVCLQMSLLWGTGTIIMIDFIHPITQRLTVDMVPVQAGWLILAVFYLVFGADLTVTVSIMVGLNKRLAQLDELRTSMRTVSDSMSEMLGESALQTQQKVDENKVQAALARAELRDIAEERRRELQDHVQERRKERDEYRRRMEETLHKQLTSGRVFGPRRLLRAFPDSKHMRYGELWKLLSEEINGETEKKE